MWSNLWHEHRGSLVGLGCGLLLGFIYLFVGFWSMLVFAFIVYLAFLVGRHYVSLEQLLRELANRLLERFRS